MVDVGDVDVAKPDRMRAVLFHLFGEWQQASGKSAVAAADRPVVAIFRHVLADVPANDSVVERLCAFRIRRHQLVPDEVARRVPALLSRGFSFPNIGHRSISSFKFIVHASALAGSNVLTKGLKPPQNMRLPS